MGLAGMPTGVGQMNQPSMMPTGGIPMNIPGQIPGGQIRPPTTLPPMMGIPGMMPMQGGNQGTQGNQPK